MTRTTRPMIRVVAAACLAVGTLCSASARAQLVTAAEDYQSPQHFCMEIKFGPYAPAIDDEFSGGQSAYGHIFGDGTNVMIKGELDWQIWRGFGAVGLGGVLGYYGNSAQAYGDNSPDGTTPSTSTTRAGSETSITLIPLSLLAVYRFDWPAHRFRIPLVPFVKIGINYTIWWIDLDGNTASYNGDEAKGGTFGWQFNGGAALLLDVLEPKAAKMLDVELGINHSYLFFEFVHVARFGSTKLNVGDTTWNAGIAFEF